MRKTSIRFLAVLFASAFWLPAAWADADAGKAYFTSIEGGNCKSCHYTNDRRMVGPGLADVTRLHTEEWLHLWLKDPQGTWQAEHPETLDLKSRTRKQRSRATSCVKKPMTDEQMDDLLDFLKTLETE